MTKYRVTMTECITTTYEVEATDEEDAFDAVRSGEGTVIETEWAESDEFGPPDDTMTAVLVEESDNG